MTTEKGRYSQKLLGSIIRKTDRAQTFRRPKNRLDVPRCLVLLRHQNTLPVSEHRTIPGVMQVPPSRKPITVSSWRHE